MLVRMLTEVQERTGELSLSQPERNQVLTLVGVVKVLVLAAVPHHLGDLVD